MQDGVGAGGDAFDAHLARGRMKQGDELGGPIFRILMGLLNWLSFRLPMIPRIGNGLVGTRFILRPDGQSFLLSYRICLLDEFFLAQASGSVTSTVPLLRTRRAVPVLHQVRSFCQVYPASWRTQPMVCVLT